MAGGRQRGSSPSAARPRGAPILLVPSLINRAYILDLTPARSFARYLRERGLRPYLVDWGAPGADERGFGLDDYIAGRLMPALEAARRDAGRPIALAGYCMGGTMVLPLAARAEVGSLVLLATPWDFPTADGGHQARLVAAHMPALAALVDALDMLPGRCAAGDVRRPRPAAGGAKVLGLRRPAAGFGRGAQLRRAGGLAETMRYRSPARWRAPASKAGTAPTRRHGAPGGWTAPAVRPEHVRVPALNVVPARDRIVPAGLGRGAERGAGARRDLAPRRSAISG